MKVGEIKKQLRQLTETAGPSGFEAPIADEIVSFWTPLVDSCTRDHMGNLIAVKSGSGPTPRPRILLAAHMDEIGLMVSRVVAHHGNGFLRVTNLGGVDNRHLYGQLVTVHGKRPLTGIIGALPDRMLPAAKRKKALDYETLAVDTGLPYDELTAVVSIGDVVAFKQPLRTLLGKRVSGKALDNRASVTAVTVCLDYLQGRSHQWDVLAVATTQEETGLQGAYNTSYAERPDIAIAIDVTFAKGPGATDADLPQLGDGPTLDWGPNVHPGIHQALSDAADALEMKTGIAIHTRGSGTDAFALQIARSGIPTGIVSIPLRYMHTMVESVDLKDIQRSGRLLGEMVARLDSSFLPALAANMMDEQPAGESQEPL